MRKLIYIVSAILLFVGCSDDNESTEQQLQTIDGGIIKNSQLVTITSENINQDEYQGTIENENIDIYKISENELVFILPSNIPTGERILNINNLNDLNIKYQVVPNEINGSAEENLSPFITNFENHIQSIQNLEDQNYLNNVLGSFNEAIADMSIEEKTEIANIYQTNKPYFDNLINSDFASRMNGTEYPIQFQIALYALGTSAILAIAYPEPATKLLFLVSAIVVAKKAYDYGINFINLNNIKVENVSLGGLLASLQNRSTMMTSLELNSGIQSSFPLGSNTRALIGSDSNDENETISGFFENFSSFNTTVENLNGAINFINDVFFFSDIENLPVLTINETNPVISTLGNEDFYNSLNFSITDNNVNIDNISFTDGNINITASIIDESSVSEFVDTSINFTYEDEFNRLTGSYPVKIYLENNDFDILGNWDIVDINSSTCEEPLMTVAFYSINLLDDGTFIPGCNCSGYDNNSTYSYNDGNLTFVAIYNTSTIYDEISFTGTWNEDTQMFIGTSTRNIEEQTASGTVTSTCSQAVSYQR
ncbi:hypothetical protein [Winogradskyella pulchriflava]|uniref:Lipoprotein n=1 Tax=Winogradskyella pulchriflava TaxID=1110688 RepID=A0ABV6QC43_9FLAO